MLIETKGERSKEQTYDFDKQFFSIGGRKGFDKDFKLLVNMLKKITLYLIKNHAFA